MLLKNFKSLTNNKSQKVSKINNTSSENETLAIKNLNLISGEYDE